MQKRGPSDIQKRTEQRQLAELSKLEAQETKRTAASQRRTRGRASLISGSERGVGAVGFEEKNIATAERIKTESAAAATARSLADKKRRESLLGQGTASLKGQLGAAGGYL